MSGQELKKILNEEGINLSELATALGFSNSQRLHSALNAQDVRSGLIEAIAKATNKSVGFYYREFGCNVSAIGDDSVAVSGNCNNIEMISSKFIALLEKKDIQIDKLISIVEKLQ